MNASPATLRPFSVRIAQDRREVVVTLTGELDLASAAVLERELRALRLDVQRVVVDLREVEFIDSTGLRLLLSLRNSARRERRGLLLVAGRSRVQRIFDLTGTRGLFEWAE